MMTQLAEMAMQAPTVATTTPDAKAKMQMALKVVKAQPGRPPKEEMIRTLMVQKGLTRAQAKQQIVKFDQYMASQFIQQQEQANLAMSIDPSRAKPLTRAIFMGE
jgi:hypothetical protein